jgi:hypothetical protein
MLNRGVVNNFEKVIKREEVVVFDRHIIKLIEGSHNNK